MELVTSVQVAVAEPGVPDGLTLSVHWRVVVAFGMPAEQSSYDDAMTTFDNIAIRRASNVAVLAKGCNRAPEEQGRKQNGK
jgi:hypothetical protein